MIHQVASFLWYTLPSLRGRLWGLPGSSTSLFLRATLFDPDRPSRISPLRSFCVGFRNGNTVATCSSGYEAELLWGVRSPLRPTGFSVYASRALFGHSRYRTELSGKESCIDLFDILRCTRNTRYGRLVRPDPTGTFTPQEMPGLARRTTNVLANK
jgi:hypothetical protein